MLQVFSVYDSAVEAYAKPFFAVSIGEARRSFMDACNDPQMMFAKHPDDYTLFHLGAFDESNAVFETLLTPTSLGKAIEYVSAAKSGAGNGSAVAE